jgi:hypothetical protein
VLKDSDELLALYKKESDRFLLQFDLLFRALFPWEYDLIIRAYDLAQQHLQSSFNRHFLSTACEVADCFACALAEVKDADGYPDWTPKVIRARFYQLRKIINRNYLSPDNHRDRTQIALSVLMK